jgi:hypothetical protein
LARGLEPEKPGLGVRSELRAKDGDFVAHR